MGLFSQVNSMAYSGVLYTLLSHSVTEISANESVKRTNAIFLDAREIKEFNVSHIPNAKHVGYDNFDVKKLDQLLNTTDEIIVYCSVGYRSEKVAEKLIKAGYTNVSNLYGGIFEWVNTGNKVVDSTGTTKKVHAFDKTWGIWLNRGEKVYD